MYFQSFLQQIASVKIEYTKRLIFNWDKIFNTAIFKEDFFNLFDWNTEEYKKIYLSEIQLKSDTLQIIINKIRIAYKKNKLSKNQYKYLRWEIASKMSKLEFLAQAYDIEASKAYWKNSIKKINYNKYNKIIFGFNKLPRLPLKKQDYLYNDCQRYQNIYTQSQLQELISYSSQIHPGLNLLISEVANSFFSNWTVHISQKDKYNIQDIITVFFHEATHYFRWKNWINNLWFAYRSSSCDDFEEGLALYNEYNYWNKICNYGSYVPYYNLCLSIIYKQKLSEEEKIHQIHEILSCKWFSQKKSLSYYHRFHRFTPYWSKTGWLKDALYYQSYILVNKLIDTDVANYDTLMSWRIWKKELQLGLYDISKNEDSALYFENMMQKIQSIL